MAVFKAEAAFIITGRGLVWAGLLAEGRVNTGDIIIIHKDGAERRRTISGVEMMSRTEKTGLLIQCVNDTETQELRHWDIEGLEFQVVPADL